MISKQEAVKLMTESKNQIQAVQKYMDEVLDPWIRDAAKAGSGYIYIERKHNDVLTDEQLDILAGRLEMLGYEVVEEEHSHSWGSDFWYKVSWKGGDDD